jgi:O-antigen ligase
MKYNFYSAIFFGLFLGTLFNILLFYKVIHVGYGVYFPTTTRFMGTTENPNTTASVMFLSIFVGVIYTYYVKNIYLLFMGYLNIAISYYIILIAVSRTGLVVSLGLIGLLILSTLSNPKRRGYFLWGLLLALIVAGFMVDLTAVVKTSTFALQRIGFIFASLSGSGVEHSADERLEFVITALNVFRDNPFFGTGMDTARVYLGVYAHNNYAELLADSGIIGTTLYYLIYISVGIKAYFVKDKWIRAYLIMFVLSLFAYDMGGVSYYDKLTLISIVFASYIAETSALKEKST